MNTYNQESAKYFQIIYRIYSSHSFGSCLNLTQQSYNYMNVCLVVILLRINSSRCESAGVLNMKIFSLPSRGKDSALVISFVHSRNRSHSRISFRNRSARTYHTCRSRSKNRFRACSCQYR